MWLPLPEATRRRLVERAERLFGHARAFDVKGVRFLGDCAGFVEAVYQAEGLPFREAISVSAADRGSGVAAIYRTLPSLGMLFDGGTPPLPGDLIFWSDTYDRDGDGDTNDTLTHMGIVEDVSRGGTVTFLHRGGRGVSRGRMNLRDPNVPRDGSGQVLNTRLRVIRSSDPAGTRYLAGQLFAAFGRFDPPLLAAALDGSEWLRLDALGLGEGAPEEMAFPLTAEQLARAPVQDE